MDHSSHSFPRQHAFTALLSRKKSLSLSKSDSNFEHKLYKVLYSPTDLFVICAQVHSTSVQVVRKKRWKLCFSVTWPSILGYRCEQSERWPEWKEIFIDQKKISTEIQTEIMPTSLGTRHVNQNHPWKLQLASLKDSWVPRNQRHPGITWVIVKRQNYNLSREMGKDSQIKGKNILIKSESIATSNCKFSAKTEKQPGNINIGLQEEKIFLSICYPRWKIENTIRYWLLKQAVQCLFMSLWYKNDLIFNQRGLFSPLELLMLCLL